MFKLQRLEITGFKSFADYTEIVFTGSGITAVVGPNGCGKSNVSDSISWVLGEQKAKSLRGEDMKDVVFQGTSKRKASGMAEVVLHLVRDEESMFAADVAESLVGAANVVRDLPPSMGAEDFSFMLEAKPGAFARLGQGGAEGGCFLHNSTYDFNDAVIPLGAGYLAALAEAAMPVRG